MTISSNIHDSQTCTLNSGQPCDMCLWANESESSQTTPPLPSFADEWELAPLSMTRTTERECAEYWYEQGRRAERRELLTRENSDMKEILRVVKERTAGGDKDQDFYVKLNSILSRKGRQ